MKKILLVLAGGMLISLTITNSAFAQQSDAATNGKDSLILAKNDQPRGSLFDVMPGNTMAGAETVSKKAIKNFTGAFNNAENVKWFPLKDGFIAYCNVNGNPTRVFYDRGGHHRYTTKSYGEKQLPTEVRAMVKRTYYDFSIYHVMQVDAENKVVYLVYIKDENAFKTIRVSDGEMDEYESHNYLH